jgi:hypothetical protein
LIDLGLPGSATVQPDIDLNDDYEVSSGPALSVSAKLSAQLDLNVFFNRIASLHLDTSFNPRAHLIAFISVGVNVNPNRSVSHSNLFLCSCFNIKELFLDLRYRLHANCTFGITIIFSISADGFHVFFCGRPRRK